MHIRHDDRRISVLLGNLLAGLAGISSWSREIIRHHRAEIVLGEHGVNPGHGEGLCGVDALECSVRIGAAHEGSVHHLREIHIVNVGR